MGLIFHTEEEVMNKILPIILVVVFLSSCSSPVEELLSCKVISDDRSARMTSLGTYNQDILIKNNNEIKMAEFDLTQIDYDDFKIRAQSVTEYTPRVYKTFVLYYKADKRLYIEEFHAKSKFFSFLPFVDYEYKSVGSLTYNCK